MRHLITVLLLTGVSGSGGARDVGTEDGNEARHELNSTPGQLTGAPLPDSISDELRFGRGPQPDDITGESSAMGASAAGSAELRPINIARAMTTSTASSLSVTEVDLGQQADAGHSPDQPGSQDWQSAAIGRAVASHSQRQEGEPSSPELPREGPPLSPVNTDTAAEVYTSESIPKGSKAPADGNLRDSLAEYLAAGVMPLAEDVHEQHWVAATAAAPSQASSGDTQHSERIAEADPPPAVALSGVLQRGGKTDSSSEHTTADQCASGAAVSVEEQPFSQRDTQAPEQLTAQASEQFEFQLARTALQRNNDASAALPASAASGEQGSLPLGVCIDGDSVSVARQTQQESIVHPQVPLSTEAEQASDVDSPRAPVTETAHVDPVEVGPAAGDIPAALAMAADSGSRPSDSVESVPAIELPPAGWLVMQTTAMPDNTEVQGQSPGAAADRGMEVRQASPDSLAQHAQPGLEVLPPAEPGRRLETVPEADAAPAGRLAGADARTDEVQFGATRSLPRRGSASIVSPQPAAGAPQDADPAADEQLLSAAEGLPPDHPLLARAQAALRAQLQATRLRLEQELSEKRKAQKARPGVASQCLT